jgi:hypothetical protein
VSQKSELKYNHRPGTPIKQSRTKHRETLSLGMKIIASKAIV